MSEVKYKVEDDIDYILEESGKMYTALRKVSWNKHDAKIDIRKWYVDENNGEDKPGKGITLTDEGCNELTVALVKENFGSTKQIIGVLKNRDNFKNDLKAGLMKSEKDEDSDEDDSELYDVNELFQ